MMLNFYWCKVFGMGFGCLLNWLLIIVFCLMCCVVIVSDLEFVGVYR